MRKKMSEEVLAKLRANIAKAREAKRQKNLGGGVSELTDDSATGAPERMRSIEVGSGEPPAAQSSVGIVGWRRGWEKVIKPK